MRTVTVSIDTFGNTQIEADGFVGSTCADATAVYIDALAGNKSDESKKPEYDMPVNTAGTVNQNW